MSNTSITNLQISDTFQVWVNKTNELVDLVNSNVVLANLGSPVEVTGNAAITGTFTANTLTSSNGTIGNLSVLTLERSVDSDEQIVSLSPMKIQSSVENIFDLQTSSGNRPILRMINGGNARWVLGHTTTSGSAAFRISTEGASTSQVTISQAGRVIANQFQGDGSLLTNLNIGANDIPDLDASKIVSGVFNVARIPNLNASKITGGVFDVARIPDLNASKITGGVFNVARIPDLNASKITGGVFDDGRIPSTIVRTSRTLNGANGIGTIGNLSQNRTIQLAGQARALHDLSSNGIIVRRGSADVVSRLIQGTANQITVLNGNGINGNPVISAVIATQSEAEATTNLNNTKLMTPLRTRQAILSSQFGTGQSWQNFTGSRSINTIYTNNTGRPIQIAVTFSGSFVSPEFGPNQIFNVTLQVRAIGSNTWVNITPNTFGLQHANPVIPAGHSYRLLGSGTGSVTISNWAELR